MEVTPDLSEADAVEPQVIPAESEVYSETHELICWPHLQCVLVVSLRNRSSYRFHGLDPRISLFCSFSGFGTSLTDQRNEEIRSEEFDRGLKIFEQIWSGLNNSGGYDPCAQQPRLQPHH
ncbi:hypothetical protein NPIL_172251 [Nephila pilipes]|uniref:Uncharacterized protein n=1 Tax=Nephila pilipes TaxID=299642 RepID=A0A8X6T601_NEPPI|nr:hypothetical protein NPIL_172251 [Nephila pilipes]